MALTAEQRQALLIARVGETPGNLLASNIAALWELYAPQAAVSATLRDLYVRRDLIEIALGDARSAVTFSDGDYSQSAGQNAQRLAEMLTKAQAEIDAELAKRGGGGVAIGAIAKTSPVMPPSAPPVRPYGPDALDPPYVGDPYSPSRGRAGRRW